MAAPRLVITPPPPMPSPPPSERCSSTTRISASASRRWMVRTTACMTAPGPFRISGVSRPCGRDCRWPKALPPRRRSSARRDQDRLRRRALALHSATAAPPARPAPRPASARRAAPAVLRHRRLGIRPQDEGPNDCGGDEREFRIAGHGVPSLRGSPRLPAAFTSYASRTPESLQSGAQVGHFRMLTRHRGDAGARTRVPAPGSVDLARSDRPIQAERTSATKCIAGTDLPYFHLFDRYFEIYFTRQRQRACAPSLSIRLFY